MKVQKTLMQTGATFVLSLFAASVMAAVSADQAAKLGTSLTPVGAEKAGNASGTIPEWTGGLSTTAAKVDDRGFMADPFAGEQPEFHYRAKHGPVQRAADPRPAGNVQALS